MGPEIYISNKVPSVVGAGERVLGFGVRNPGLTLGSITCDSISIFLSAKKLTYSSFFRITVRFL